MKEGAQHGEGGYGWGEDMDMEEEEEGGGGKGRRGGGRGGSSNGLLLSPLAAAVPSEDGGRKRARPHSYPYNRGEGPLPDLG